MSGAITIAILGAGHRGQDVYGDYLLKCKDRARVVALAEPNPYKRRKMASDHSIPDGMRFSHWRDLLAKERLAQGIVIATPDHLHYQPAIEALRKGYHILLEKPISSSPLENLSLLKESKRSKGRVLVAHVLRYTDFFQHIRGLLLEEVIGVPQYINYTEEIGYFHFAHSYVRGNWRNEEVAAPIILAKSCHDMDMISYLTGKKALSLSSKGRLQYFHKEFQPEGASDRCLSCKYVDSCIYSAPRIYLSQKGWPTSAITGDTSIEGINRVLKEGPYGRCVYACDNTAPETQTVHLLLEDGLQAQFALTAFSKDITRRIFFRGSHGEMYCNLWEGVVEIKMFNGETIKQSSLNSATIHGGGDKNLLERFIGLCEGEEEKESALGGVVESHLLAIAAEESRREERAIDMIEWREKQEMLLAED